ncbi:hypothetical protein [Pseudocolwellia sp. HL-MZ7]
MTYLTLLNTSAADAPTKAKDISDLITKEKFSSYANVADFIDDSPRVTVIVQPEDNDIAEYGNSVMKSLTGSDCDRDGEMDDNATCNRVYLKLWLKYTR